MFRVLVLDDDPHFGQILARALQGNAHFVCEAVAVVSAEEAYDAVRQTETPFDAFLIDQRLGPGPDGITVFQELRSLSSQSEGIVFTMAGDIDSGLRAYRAGAYRYLHKPFEPDELILVLQLLRSWRTVRYERDWLQGLAKLAEDVQPLQNEYTMAQVIAEACRKLGFERARLWRLDETGTVLQALAEANNDGLISFAEISFVMDKSPYAKQVLAKQEPQIFHALDLGDSYLYRRFDGADFQPPRGDWVGVPLWSGNQCLGLLILDNYTRLFSLGSERQAGLQLLGQQVAAALARARTYDAEIRQTITLERQRKELEVLAEIGRRVSNRAAKVGLDTLLKDVHSLLDTLMDVRNFFIVLVNEQTKQLNIRLDIVDNKQRQTRTLPNGDGLASYVIKHNRPLLLRTRSDVRAFFEDHGVARVRKGRAARCWLGVPLQVEERAIGAIVLQNTREEVGYTPDDERLLVAVANQVAGAIQTAWLTEEADLNARRLMELQNASGALISLAEQDEDWLWRAALTIATAGYAIGFNRAMLFLTEDGGTMLRGRMGIGQFDTRKAHTNWENDRKRDRMSFAEFEKLLRSGTLLPTPLDDAVRSLEIPLSDDQTVFSITLRTKNRSLLPASEAAIKLPQPLIQWFGETECAVLPVFVGKKSLGLVVVDNIHNREPLADKLLDQLEIWLAQVALVYENRRQRKATDRLIDVNHTVLAEVSSQSLRETLRDICTAAQAITEADCVMISPLTSDSQPDNPLYDTENVAVIGLLNEHHPRARLGKAGVTYRVLQSSAPVVVEDVRREPWIQGQTLVAHAFIQREKVLSFIAAPIRDVVTGDVTGVLYLNYRVLQTFNDQDRQRAESFAILAGSAIRSGRARTREAEMLRGVLERALRPDVTRENLARVLLEAARDLLEMAEAQAGLILREWAPSSEGTEKSEEVRKQYFLLPDGSLQQRSGRRLYTGITGRAFSCGEDQSVPDITKDPDYIPWYAEAPGDGVPAQGSELDVLIRLEEREIIGVLNIESEKVDSFTAEHHAMLRRLAAAAALALDNIQRQESLRMLLDVAQTVVAPTELQQTLEKVVEGARGVAPGVSSVHIWYKDPESGHIRLGLYFDARNSARMTRSDTIKGTSIWNVIRHARPVWASDVLVEPLLAGRFVKQEQIQSAAAFPLQTEDEVVGVLFFNYHTRHIFTAKEQLLFPILAAFAASSIRDALRLEELQRSHAKLEVALKDREAAFAITHAVGTTSNLSETLRAILQTLISLFPKARPCVLTYNLQRRELEVAPESLTFYSNDVTEHVLAIDDKRPHQSIACRVARRALSSGKPDYENVSDVTDDLDYLGIIANTQSELCLALMSDDHRLLGVLVLESEDRDAFDQEDVRLLQAAGQAISIALDRAYRSAELGFQRSVAAASAWVAELAHDINHEIREIRYQSYMLAQQLPDALRPSIEAINQSAERLVASGRAPESTKAESLILDTWLRSTIEEKVDKMIAQFGTNVELQFELTCGNQRVRTSPVWLERVLRHLLRNAFEAMSSGDKLLIRTQTSYGKAEVLVRNSGRPILEDVRQRLFVEPASSKTSERGDEGGGLGLLFARWAIEAMGGTIELVSQPEEDVTFIFTLPLYEAEDARNVLDKGTD